MVLSNIVETEGETLSLLMIRSESMTLLLFNSGDRWFGLNEVIPSKEHRFRLDWYTQIKMPLLTANLLRDQGSANLESRMEAIMDTVKNEIRT